MGLMIALVLAPLLFMVAAVYVVLNVAAMLLRIVFAPLLWLANRPPRQRVELRHYSRR